MTPADPCQTPATAGLQTPATPAYRAGVGVGGFSTTQALAGVRPSSAPPVSAALLMLARQDVTPPPCAGGDGWTSEDPDERALAARCCAGCALFGPCRVLADELKVTFGVWAGVDRTPTTRKGKAQQ
jgi:hypothetical protein